MLSLDLTEDEWFRLGAVYAVISVTLSLLGVYFIVRWGITLSVVGEDTRRLLLGESMSNLMDDPETIQMLVAVYVGISFMGFMVGVVKWKKHIEQETKRVYNT